MLESVIYNSADCKKIQLLIADTGISDKTNRYLNQLKSKFHKKSSVVKMSYHFSKNNNALAKLAIFDYLFFLNNDVIVETKRFDEIVLRYLRLENIGTVGIKLIYSNRTVQHASVQIIHEGVNKGLAYHPNRFNSEGHPKVNEARDVDANTGAFLCVKKNDFERIGGFDERYIEEAQDVDLCFKISAIGKRNFYLPEVVAYHLENGTRHLNSSCPQDRRLLIDSWKDFISLDYLKKINNNNYSKNILIKRKGARGDIIAVLALVNFLKKTNLDIKFDLMTDYVDIASIFNVFDNTLQWGEAYLANQYDLVINAEYENEIWRYSTKAWFDALAISLSLNPEQFEFIDLYSDLAKTINIKPSEAISKISCLSPFVVIAVSAGWREREISADQWNVIISNLRSHGYKIVVLAGNSEYSDHIDSDLFLINVQVADILEIFKMSHFNFLLDSFLLHVALIVDYKKIKSFTCKTTIDSVFGPGLLKEFRADNSLTPVMFCQKYGCRFKFGDGTYLKCTKNFLNIGRAYEID